MAGTTPTALLEELLGMIDQAEAYDGRRLECLVKLAQLRKQSLRDLMLDLGTKPPKYA